MATFHIAVLPGDGISPEVTTEAVRVCRALEARIEELRFQFTEYAVGAGEYLKNGDPLPDEAFKACQQSDAVLLGAIGLPQVRWPDGKEMTPQLDLREKLDLYCGLRPIRLFHAADTPLKRYQTGEIDLLIVRENCEGLFSSRLADYDLQADEVRDTLRITRRGAERIIRAAFQQATLRRKQVALIDKANVLPSMVYFRDVFQRIAKEFPEHRTDCVYVDAAALYLVQDPGRFDVLVTENMFGDILSDLAAGLVGGMGMAPSADIGERCAVFQPAHGSAPDIAGKGIANPIATILSAAMMLEWLGTSETRHGAALIRRAVERVFADPDHRTSDMGGRLSTEQMGRLVVEQINQESG